MILITVGTHEQPFDRLVEAGQRIAVALGEEVVVQGGPSRVPTPDCERFDLLHPDALAAAIARARLVITHGGPSTLSEVIDAGRPVVVVPRDPAHGEHVDDHQLRFAESLPEDVVRFVGIDALVDWTVRGQLPPAPDGRRSAAATAAYCEALEEVLQSIRHPRISGAPGFRAMVARILRRLPNGS